MIAWWSKLSLAIKLVGYIGVITAAIVSTATAWPYLEPYWYAHRGYVRQYSAPASDHAILIEMRITQNGERRERLLNDVKKYELEMQSDQAKQTPIYQELLKDQVERASKTLKHLDDDDNSLFKEKLSK